MSHDLAVCCRILATGKGDLYKGYLHTSVRVTNLANYFAFKQ